MLAVAGLFLAACGQEDNEFAGLKTANAEDAVVVPGFSAAELGVIDLNTVEVSEALDVQAFTVSEAALPDGVELAKGEIVFEDGTVIPTTASGQVSGKELSAYIASLYGRRPVERTVVGHVYLYAVQNGAAVKIDAGEVTFVVVPKAPVIEEAYYLTGTLNGWDNTNTDFVLSNGGQDPYENPTFTCTIDLEALGYPESIQFKATPVSGVGGDWSGCLAAAEEEGKFNYDNNGGNMVITADPDALFYDLTFNMLDQTWSATPVGFNEFIYEIGNESGWSEPHPLYGNGLGQYEAIIWLDGEFKFKPNKDNWDGDWEKASGDATSGTLTTDGGPNIDAVAAGFYLVQVDLKEMTYKLTAVNSISIIGSVRGMWDTDIDMTYNENFKCWEARETLSAGEFKFRLNHDWGINWGGTMDVLEHDGANLQLAADGAYIIRFFINGEGPAHCTVKEDSGYPDFFYEIGNEGGWSTNHQLAGNGSGQYQGYYWLDGEFKFKPNKDNWDNDLEYISGTTMSGTLTDGGGPNCPDPGAGFYQINLDVAAMTYNLLKIESISMIGGFNGWGEDLEMAYNTAEGCWEVTTDAVSGEYKFRANHDWAINWGGSETDLTQDGSNLNIEAGTYKFQLYISYAGNNHVVITKQ